jgi:KDO2-lipid IV(A) lauroyltransferase
MAPGISQPGWSARERAGSRSAELRYRLQYSLLLVLRESFRHLSPRVAVTLGGVIGRIYACLGGPRTGDAVVNLRIAFPEWSDRERRRVLEACFANMGRSIAEACLLQGRHREALLEGVRIDGLENYRVAKEASATGGVVVVTAHFGSWELCGAAIAHRGFPLCVVHHDLGNPYVEALVTSGRRSSGLEELVVGGAALGVLRALRRGRIVAMLLDQNAHPSEGVFAPFFSELASTRAAPAAMAMKRGFSVLPVFIFREGESERHVVRIYPSIEMESGSDDQLEDRAALERNVTRMNGAIEAAIRGAPDHWMWPHRRWKTRPEGDGRRLYRRRGS